MGVPFIDDLDVLNERERARHGYKEPWKRNIVYLDASSGREINEFILNRVQRVAVDPSMEFQSLRLLLDIGEENHLSITVSENNPAALDLLNCVFETSHMCADLLECRGQWRPVEWRDATGQVMSYRRQQRNGPLTEYLVKAGERPHRPARVLTENDHMQLGRSELLLDAHERKRDAEAATKEADTRKKFRAAVMTDEIRNAEKEASAAEARATAAEKATTTGKARVEADGDDDDKYEKYRDEIEALIEEPQLGWDAIKGQHTAVKKGKRYVNAINGDYQTKPPAALLLYGSPGTGKTTMGMVIASQMEGTTFFNVPKNFGAGKSILLKALFAIAAEHTPSIIMFDEIDGVMSTKHSANVPEITAAWAPVKASGSSTEALPPFVLVIGTTNHPERLDGAIQNRFGHDAEPRRSIEFGPLDDDARKAIFEDHLRKVTCPLSSEDWNTLLRLTHHMDGRSIAALAAEVANIVEDDHKQNGRDNCTISLADFQKFIEENSGADERTMSTEKKSTFAISWCRQIFGQRTNPGTGPAEQVISVRYMIEELLTDKDLETLGVKSIQKLRTAPKYFSKNTKETVFLDNLKECLQKTFPLCTLEFNTDGKEKTFCGRRRITTRHPVGNGYSVTYNPTETNARDKVWYVTHLGYIHRPIPP